MSDAAPTSPQTVPSEAPPEWKPEPRQWGWKDLFTAPMLAFKPKCMVVSAITLVLLSLWWALFTANIDGKPSLSDNLYRSWDTTAWWYLGAWSWVAVGAVVFGLGTTFVATILKADLLDDEFLSFREAWQQFRPRLLPAVLVPLFMLVLPTGLWLLLFLGTLVGSIPYVGPFLYALLWIVGVLGALFTILVTIAALLSISLFPAIIAIRRHGWFDNVVDTVEAVGTKPHLLVGSLLLTWILTLVAVGIASGAVGLLGSLAAKAPGEHLRATEVVAHTRQVAWLSWPTKLTDHVLSPGSTSEADTIDHHMDRDRASMQDGWVKWGPGLLVAFQKTLVAALILGYALNLFLAGGMLTYLWVREDDYWDDEDLQDLDKLAQELEAEAKAQPEAPAPA